MSKRETPMTLWYWEQVGGELMEEFPIVRKGEQNAQRLIDGVVVLNKPKRRLAKAEFYPTLEGLDVILIQTKAYRLGMYLMGQTLFSRELALLQQPKSVRSIALCSKPDDVMQPLLEAHEGCSAVVCPASVLG